MSFLDERQKQILQVMGIQVWQERGRAEPQENHPERPSAGQPASDQPYEEYAQAGGSMPRPTATTHAQAPDVSPATRKTANNKLPVSGTTPDVSQFDWDRLRQAVSSCTACEMAQTRTTTVFGVGNQKADWLFIGEAPGAEEDRQGKPFVGSNGELLDAMLKAIALDRQKVFITNVLKCRTPGNRDPKPEETSLCSGYLNRQIELVKPRLIVAVGRIAAQQLLQTSDSLARLRGKVHYYGANKTPMIVTYHPAYLLRSPAQKRKAWEDLLLGQRLLKEAG